MSKKDWGLVIGVVIAIWLVDQATKLWAIESLGSLSWHGFIGLVKHKNPGAMLGIFSDLPPLLRVVSLSTGGAFLVFIYAAIQYLLPRRSMILRLGMSILLGGILGNVTDRINTGAVVDFLVLGMPSFSTPAFNVADAVQWVGYFMIVYTLIAHGDQIWPEKNARKRIWVNPSFQIKYIGILLSIGLGFSIIVSVFSFTYLKIVIDELVIGRATHIEQKFIIPYMITFLIISLSFLIILFIIGRTLSHRTAGPLYAFERFLDDLVSGKDRALRLRAGDEFSHLEHLAERIRKRWNEKQAKAPPEKSSEDNSV